MAILYGTQSDGALVPVQADSQGRLVAELTDEANIAKCQDGTFVPTIDARNGGLSVTYAEQDGQYFRVGEWVTANFHVDLSSVSGGSTDFVVLKGFPYPAMDRVGSWTFSGLVSYFNNWSASYKPTSGRLFLFNGETHFRLQTINANQGNTDSIPTTALTNTSRIEGQVTYRTDDTSLVPTPPAVAL